jgi:hypothetical protein
MRRTSSRPPPAYNMRFEVLFEEAMAEKISVL